MGGRRCVSEKVLRVPAVAARHFDAGSQLAASWKLVAGRALKVACKVACKVLWELPEGCPKLVVLPRNRAGLARDPSIGRTALDAVRYLFGFSCQVDAAGSNPRP